MKTVGLYEAKTHFGELLRDVEKGETVTITRHGKVIARLVPAGKSVDDAVAAMEDLNRFRRERRPTLNGITIRELVEEGRE
jgi:prevent-host-death family protein